MSKIPPSAKRVFKGEIFEVWQWDQKMFDGTTETFEMLKRPDTVQVIPTVNGKIAVAYQEQPNHPLAYSLFGGRVEEDEEPLAAAKRELLEESGLESSDWELWKTYDPRSKIQWTLYYFIARNCQKTGEQKLDAGEKIAVREVDLEEYIKIFSSESYGEFSADLLRMLLEAEKLEEFKKKLFK